MPDFRHNFVLKLGLDKWGKILETRPTASAAVGRRHRLPPGREPLQGGLRGEDRQERRVRAGRVGEVRARPCKFSLWRSEPRVIVLGGEETKLARNQWHGVIIRLGPRHCPAFGVPEGYCAPGFRGAANR